ncbi:MAG: hypothetical protein H6868_02000 [Rhodospirillales bacterium]|nr:hypothetical protein [Rhodospirillales bacterium]
MREIKAKLKATGKDLPYLLNADDVDHETKCDYACRCPDCEKATYHWVQGSAGLQNTDPKKPYWRRDPSSQHGQGCKYDFEAKASKHRETTFYEEGFYHLRVNFPLGSSPGRDRWVKGHLSKTQIEAAHNHTDKPAVSSISAMVKFLEREFDSIEDDGLSSLKLWYQGEDYEWKDLFIGSDQYRQLVDAATRSDKHLDPLNLRPLSLTVVKPTARHDLASSKDKTRVYCEPQRIWLRTGKSLTITPRLTFENDKLRNTLVIDRPMLVSSRPFYPAAQRAFLRNRLISGEPPSNIPVDLYVSNAKQLAEIDPGYWHAPEPPDPQISMAFRSSKNKPA